MDYGARPERGAPVRVETVALIIAAALAALIAVILVYPFLKPRLRPRPGEEEAGPDPVSSELEPIYDAIRTLQLEYQLGKVPEPLYRDQLSGYRLQAADVLRRQAEAQADAKLRVPEQEGRPAPTPSLATDGPELQCSNCGAVVDPGLTACPGCGVAPGLGA